MADRTCSVDGCTRGHYARSWCYKHYKRWLARGTVDPAPRPSTAERLWAKIRVSSAGCWEWQGPRNKTGYGMTYCPNRKHVIGAHRVTYELFFGLVPKGLELDHLCRVRHCVNPAHLEAVTHAENMRRGISGLQSKQRARQQTHCKWGHEYTPENTYRDPKTGLRSCRTCGRLRSRRARGGVVDETALRLGEAVGHAKGEANGRSVLNSDLVREIRASDETGTAIARRLGVSHTTIYKVRAGTAWSHVS